MCVIIWQKYLLCVGLSQHSSAISSLIVADWPLHYIIQNFKLFFSAPPEISTTWRASFPSPGRMPLRVNGWSLLLPRYPCVRTCSSQFTVREWQVSAVADGPARRAASRSSHWGVRRNRLTLSPPAAPPAAGWRHRGQTTLTNASTTRLWIHK